MRTRKARPVPEVPVSRRSAAQHDPARPRTPAPALYSAAPAFFFFSMGPRHVGAREDVTWPRASAGAPSPGGVTSCAARARGRADTGGRESGEGCAARTDVHPHTRMCVHVYMYTRTRGYYTHTQVNIYIDSHKNLYKNRHTHRRTQALTYKHIRTHIDVNT